MKQKIAYVLCTFLGVGYLPHAPGTFASFLAILILHFFTPGYALLIIITTVSIIITVTFTSEIEKKDGKDPGHIVMDEIAGQFFSFLFIADLNIKILLIGFLFFRLFDIYKPFGINHLQKYKSGWGVVLDDILAGFYTNLLLHVLMYNKVL